jgi:hypothetical protein
MLGLLGMSVQISTDSQKKKFKSQLSHRYVLLAADIPAMRFTDEPASPFSDPTGTLQIFFVKVIETAVAVAVGEVYGLMAIRDRLRDRKRNIIYARSRDNCQTITKEVCIYIAVLMYVHIPIPIYVFSIHK